MTERLRRHIGRNFSGADAASMLARLGELEVPFDRGRVSERILAAIVLLCDGDAKRLDASIREAKFDWRDLLISARLGHEDWRDELDRRLGPG